MTAGRRSAVTPVLGPLALGLSMVAAVVLLATRSTSVAALAGVTVALLGSLWLLSDQWLRRHLRVAGAVCLLLVATVLAGVGRHAHEVRTVVAAFDRINAVGASAQTLDRAGSERGPALLAEARTSTAALTEELARRDEVLGPLAQPASAVLTTLRTDPRPTSDAIDAAHVAFVNARPVQVSAAQQAVVDAEASAVSAWRTFLGFTNSDTGLRSALASTCAAAAARATSVPRPYTCQGLQAPAVVDVLEVELAVLEQRLAERRSAVLGRSTDEDAVKAAVAAVTSARATVAGPPTELAVWDAWKEGVDGMLGGLPLTEGRTRLTLDWLAWLVAGGLLLIAWRACERRAGRQEVGPVELDLETQAEGAEERALKAALRVAALQNVPEPGGIPGTARATPISDLTELVTGGSASWVKGAAAIVKAIAVEPSGYTAKVSLVHPSGTQKQWTALVRLYRVSDGSQVALKTLFGAEGVSACAAAGYWIAATILERSGRMPSWVRWSGETSTALARWAGSGRRLSLDGLVQAVAAAPHSGILLHQLGYQYDLAGRHVEALGMYARAVAAHPRYLDARYRLASCMSILAWDPAQWSRAPRSRRERVGEEVRRALDSAGVAAPADVLSALFAPDPSIAGSTAAIERAWTELGGLLYKSLDRNPVWLLPALLQRPDERDDQLRGGMAAFLARGSRRRDLARSAHLVLLTRDPARAQGAAAMTLADRVQRAAAEPGAAWQLDYNLACYYARLRRPSEALACLERALGRTGSEQLTRDWLQVDPDLAALRNLPRFTALVAGLRQLDAPAED